MELGGQLRGAAVRQGLQGIPARGEGLVRARRCGQVLARELGVANCCATSTARAEGVHRRA